MRAMKMWRGWILGVVVAAASVCGATAGCQSSSIVYEDEPGPGYGGGYTYDDGGITGDGAASKTPMLVDVDPNGTLSASPGQGVGVFVEYASTSDADPGGHWHVFWTCDTSLSGDSCPFEISATVDQGSVSNLTTEGFEPDDSASLVSGSSGGSESKQGPDREVSAQTNTTVSQQGIRFDTAPGAKITLSAALAEGYSGSFIFFVEDGMIRGGYKGELTDPIDFQSTMP